MLRRLLQLRLKGKESPKKKQILRKKNVKDMLKLKKRKDYVYRKK